MSRLSKPNSATILDACHDPKLFGPWFDGGTWDAWFAFFATVFGLEMTDEWSQIFRACTGRTEIPTEAFTEVWCSCGRRAGKSLAAATLAVFLACFRNYNAYLKPGETGVVILVAPDRRQSKVLLRYIMGFLRNVPFLKKLIVNERAESVDLANGIAIEVATASHKTSRGFTAVAVIVDEAAFLPTDESSEPDTELLVALRPTLATIPNALLLVISSPYARRGELWKAFCKHFGKNSRVLFWKAASRTMNPSLPEQLVKDELERDEASARAEYLAEFRSDVERLVRQEVVDACVVSSRFELPKVADVQYAAFCDPSGGSSDSMTLGIAHSFGRAKNGGPAMQVAVLDALREVRPPFSPDETVAEFCKLIRSYGLSEVHGDRYAGQWVVELFSKNGITYRHSEKTRSELYLELLPMLNSARVELLDENHLRVQLCGLERRVSPIGKDTVDHPRGSHDDLANAAAGALVLAVSGISQGMVHVSCGGKSLTADKFSGNRGWTGLGRGAR
jgi:hypothetical protein